MVELKCESCGAPLEPTADDRAAGACRCVYCNSVMQLPRDAAAEQLAEAAALKSRVMRALGVEGEDPRHKPADCDIELSQTPGVEFHAEIRGNTADAGTMIGVLVGGLVGGVGGGVWPTLGLAAAATHGVLSAALWGLAIGITVVAVIAAIVFVAYRVSGVEIIDARDGATTIERQVMKMRRRAAFPWDQTAAVVNEFTGWTVNEVPMKGLYLRLTGRGLVRIAKRARQKDLPWLAFQLNKFYEPILGPRAEPQ